MNIFAIQGFKEFIIATGYKSEIIDSWVDTLNEDWNIKTFFTGLNTQTGGRIKRCIERYPDKQYFVTYGDGVGNIDLKKLKTSHEQKKLLASITAVRPPARFGVLQIEEDLVRHFGEKHQTDAGWINGGFLLINSEVKDLITGDEDLFEQGALPKLAEMGELFANKHEGFWQPMDTLREKNYLSDLANLNTPPWLDL